QQNWKYWRDDVRTLRHDRGPHMLATEPRPLPEHIAQGLVDAIALFRLAAEQRDAFAVLAYARQHVTEFSFGLVSAFRNRNKLSADNRHRRAGETRVGNCRNHEKAGNGERRAGEGHVQRGAEGPKYDDKVIAEKSAEGTPATKSTGASVATRRSSAIRYSGFL